MSPDTLAMASRLCALYGLTTPDAKRALHALLLAAERDGADGARRAVARHGRGESSQDSGEAITSMRFGRSKGVPLTELEDRDLAWYARVLAENVSDESKARFAEANQQALDAVEAEMARRGSA